MRLEFLAAVCTVSLMTAWTAAQPPEEREHARARLIAETRTLIPGTTAWLALDFEIDEHWHLYWNGVNDSGMPPKLNPAFPEGFKAGDVLWPVPKRLVQPGDILDHVYERQVTLLFPVTVPADAKPGTEVTLKASPDWLVCHDVCLPGSAELSLKLSIGAAGDKPALAPHASLFAKARDRLPKPLPKQNPPLKIAAADGKVSITSPGASEVTFYPGLEGVAFTNLIRDGQRKGEQLVLGYKADSDRQAKLIGVVEAKSLGGNPPMLWSVDVDLESANKPSPGPSKPDSPVRGR